MGMTNDMLTLPQHKSPSSRVFSLVGHVERVFCSSSRRSLALKMK
jgi:hypothetical protein